MSVAGQVFLQGASHAGAPLTGVEALNAELQLVQDDSRQPQVGFTL